MMPQPNPQQLDLAVDQLAELGVKRRQFIKAKIRVMNAAGALIRRALGWRADLSEAQSGKIALAAQRILVSEDFDALPPDLRRIANALSAEIETSRLMAEPALQHIKVIEKKMRAIARTLPVWEWAKDVKGLSDLGLAIIVAEAGDLGKYDDHCKLRKRLGLAPFTKGNVTRAYSQWRYRGGLTEDEWTQAGYSPRRRAAIFAQVGTQIIGFMGKGYRPLVGEDIEANNSLSYYEKVFVRRLRYLADKNPEMRRPNTKEGKESFSKAAAFDAVRYTEQRLVKHLHRAWRLEAKISLPERATTLVPPAVDPLQSIIADAVAKALAEATN